MTIQLQGIGKRNAIKASELVIGDVMICNYGYTQKITNLEYSKSGRTLTYTVLCRDGNCYSRRTTATRLIAVERVN